MGILVGQDSKIAQIKIALQSARSRNRELPHIMFSGSAGCGKTTMAKHVASVCNVDFIQVLPDTIKDHKSARKLFDKLNHFGYDSRGNRVDKIKPSIIFVDEIHRVSLIGQEVLGIAMENYLLETGRVNKLYWLPYFTIIGATTMVGQLSRPFLNRFKISLFFNTYSHTDSQLIVRKHCDRLKIKIGNRAVEGIARRGRGVPRVLVGYIERARDLAYAIGSDTVNSAIVDATFISLGIDDNGFSKTEITILQTLYDSEIPIGLENLAIISDEDTKTLKNEIEPNLIRRGFMVRSGTGRLITRKGREYLEEHGFSGNEHDKEFISSGYERS